MKKSMTLFVQLFAAITLFSMSLSSSADTQIKSTDAAFHVGKSVIACGVVIETKRFKRGIYLNMDKPYPHQSLTLVAWEDDLPAFQERFGSVEKLEGKAVCAQGQINQYRGNSQISLTNAYSLKMQ